MQERTSTGRKPPILFVVLVVAGSLGLNLGLNVANNAFSLPFFMDSVGTAIAAVAVGLAPALIVAIGTNALFELVYGVTFTHLPFAICGVATVLIMRASLVRGYFQTVGHALIVSLVVALANAVLGSVVVTFLFGGVTAVGIDFLVTGLVASGQSLLTAAFWARIPANIIDKLIAVFAAFSLRGPLLELAAGLRGVRPVSGQ